MKSYNLFFILSIVFTLLINAGHAFSLREEKEGFYEIITYYPNGYVSDPKNPEYVEYVNGIIATLHDVIIDNISTYENPSKLDELEKSRQERLQKYNLVEDYNNYGYVYQVMTFEDSTLFYAYLSVPLVEKVRAIPGIDYCELPYYLSVDGNAQSPYEQPIAEQPVTEQPVTEQPVTEQPVTEQPVTEQPVTEQPVTEQPVTEQPVTEQPVTEHPVTEQPVTEQPVTEPVAEQNQGNVICEKKDKAETFYSVAVHYPKGEFNEEDPEYIKYLNDMIEYIHYIIIKNRSNYQNPRQLDEIQKEYEEKKSSYQNKYANYGTVYRYAANREGGVIFLSAYLNEKVKEEVLSLDDVTSVNLPTTYYPDAEEGNDEEETICFEVDDTVVESIQAPELPKIEQKEKKLVCEPRIPTEDYYKIVAKHEYEEFIIEDPEFQIYLESFMRSIDKIIYNNKDTYQDIEVVKALHKIFDTEYNKREMDYENSGSVKVLYLNEDDGTIVLSAYLNAITAEEVKKLSIVSSVEQSEEEGPATEEYCHEVEVDSITPEEDTATAVEVNDDEDIPENVDEDVTSEVDSDSEDDAVQCFSLSLGYSCCSEGAQVYYEDNDGKWGYENNNWCGISN